MEDRHKCGLDDALSEIPTLAAVRKNSLLAHAGRN